MDSRTIPIKITYYMTIIIIVLKGNEQQTKT